MVLFLALALLQGPSRPHPVADLLAKEAKAKGLLLVEKPPHMTASEAGFVEGGRARLLLHQQYFASTFRVTFLAMQMPDADDREEWLGYHWSTSGAQFRVSAPALDGTGITMFTYGHRPSEIEKEAGPFSVGAYGIAGITAVAVSVLPGAPPTEMPRLTRRQVVDRVAALTALLAKQVNRDAGPVAAGL